MSDDILVPQSSMEEYLGAMTGDYTGELPAPSSRVEQYLAKLVEQGGASAEELETLSGLVQEAIGDISDLQTSVGDNTSAISGLQSSVGTNTGDISNLKTEVSELDGSAGDPFGTAVWRLARPDYLNGGEYIDTGFKPYDDVEKDWTFAIKYRGTISCPNGVPYMIFCCKHDGVMDGAHLRYYLADDDPNLSDNNRGIDINVGSGGLGLNEPDNTGVINRGQTNIVIIVKAGDNYSLYINRSTMAYGFSLGYPIDPSLAHDLTMIIGARYSSDGESIQYKTKMVVEDARIYGRPLTDNQVKLLYEELAAM